ncbi:MAG TPA: hypothetical protein VGJ18_13425 [Gemmatimonadaceae bacterium]|jgi:hypothetical protein
MSTEPIRIDLTNEQQEQVRRDSGHAIEAIELQVQELESRIAPSEPVVYLKIVMKDATITNVNYGS